MNIIKSIGARLLIPFVLACACDTVPPETTIARIQTPLDLTTTGSISGTVHLNGPPPEQRILHLGGWSECAAQYKGTAYAKDVLVNQGHVQNCLIFVKEGLEDFVFPIPDQPAKNDQDACTFAPRIMAVQTGQLIRYLNNDSMAHNVHGFPKESRDWNFSLGRKGAVRDIVINAPELAVEVKCDIHGWMRSYLSIFDHPYFAFTDSAGSFTLKNLPAGDYVLGAWHERFGEQYTNVSVPENGDTQIKFIF